MSVKQLSPNKEIRELVRIARSQGWWIKKLKNNHLRWIPPKGPFVHSSAMLNSPRVLPKIKHDLEQAGLVLEPTYMERSKPTIVVVSPEVDQLPQEVLPTSPLSTELIQPPPQEEKPPVEEITVPRKKLEKGQLLEIVSSYMKKKIPLSLSVQQIYEGVRTEVKGKNNVNVALARLAKNGKVSRVGKGVYKWNLDQEEKVTVPTRAPSKLSKSSSEAEQLTHALNMIVEAGAIIEKAVERISDKLAVLEQLQKLLK